MSSGVSSDGEHLHVLVHVSRSERAECRFFFVAVVHGGTYALVRDVVLSVAIRVVPVVVVVLGQGVVVIAPCGGRSSGGGDGGRGVEWGWGSLLTNTL